LAALVLAIAGVVIAGSVREELKQNPDWLQRLVAQASTKKPEPAPSQPVDPAQHPAAARSLLSVSRVGEGSQSRPVVMLQRPTCAEDFEGVIKGTDPGILLREILRQAVLIAARDELGAGTRDEALGESLVGAPKNPDVEVASLYRREEKSHAMIRRLGEKQSEMLLDQPLTTYELPDLVEAVEKLSRTEFPAVLKQLGLEGRPNPQKADAPLPPGTEDRLKQMGYSDLFAAVRDLHHALRTEGESPARLSALARSYALLGVLTEFLWDPAHKVFKARALLYSQRLVARNANDPLALWNRAFVRALVGMHVSSRADLVEAEKQAKALGDRAAKAPDWVPLIDAFLRYDTKRLVAEPGTQETLAALLHLLAIEFPWLRSQTMAATKDVLTRVPDCFRAIDAMCQVGGISDLHVATAVGPQILQQVVPKKMQAIETLPAPVRETIEHHAGEPAMVKALRRAGEPSQDHGEPSWEALGHLIAETSFVQVYRRLSFMRDKWSVPVGEYWATSRIYVLEHRYRPYLESLTLPPAEALEVLEDLLKTLNIADIEVNESSMTSTLYRSIKAPRALFAAKAPLYHLDDVAHDMAQATFHMSNLPYYAQQLLAVSPHSPFGRAVTIEKDWEKAKPHLAEWENDPATGNSPTLLAALARHYTERGPTEDAQRVLKRYVVESPEIWAYQMLANSYKEQKDLKRWRETLEEFLERGDNSGLDHANIQAEIARYYMNLYQWDKAQPYAELAAQTGAGWAFEIAGQCNEGMGEYERAEYWFRSEAERYPRSFMQWFLFCQRTCRGDEAGAAQLAIGFVERAGVNLTDNEKCLAILLCDLANEPAKGVEITQRLLESTSPTIGNSGERFERWLELMFLARFADAVDNTQLRDECWEKVAKENNPAAAKAATVFREALDPKQAKPFNRKRFDALREVPDPKTCSYLEYFTGRFLERHGKIQDAFSSWKNCSNINGGGAFVPYLCTNAARTALKGQIPDDPYLWMLRGYYHRQEEKLELALKDLDKAIELSPKDLEAWNTRGIVKRASGDLDGAIADFSKLVEFHPDARIGYLGRGIAYILQKKDDEAEKDAQKALEVAPQSGLGQIIKGLLSFAQGDEAKGQESFDQALALDRSVGQFLGSLKTIVMEKRGEQAPASEPPDAQ